MTSQNISLSDRMRLQWNDIKHWKESGADGNEYSYRPLHELRSEFMRMTKSRYSWNQIKIFIRRSRDNGTAVIDFGYCYFNNTIREEKLREIKQVFFERRRLRWSHDGIEGGNSGETSFSDYYFIQENHYSPLLLDILKLLHEKLAESINHWQRTQWSRNGREPEPKTLFKTLTKYNNPIHIAVTRYRAGCIQNLRRHKDSYTVFGASLLLIQSGVLCKTSCGKTVKDGLTLIERTRNDRTGLFETREIMQALDPGNIITITPTILHEVPALVRETNRYAIIAWW